jgi:TolA-binding protein
MSQARCPRAWQAEAVLDRRLSAADRAAFERHAPTCGDCSREHRELARLRELGQRLTAADATPLSRKRQRNELLRRAHESSVSVHRVPSGSAAPRLAWLALPGAVLLLAAVLSLRAGSHGVVGAPKFETRAAPSAVWATPGKGPQTRLLLSDGSLQVAVQKLEAGQSFVVTLPDGELEVRGTRFVVEVTPPRTERVAVSEGSVALRIRGQLELLLRAGDTWNAPVATAPIPPTTAAPSSSPSARTVLAPPSAGSPPRGKPTARVPSTAPSPTHQFGEAMAAYARGDFASAEQLFRSFEAANPQSSQVEDSLFLRALARQRRGDGATAKQLAAEYVRRYPAGFRAAEARRLLEAP